VKQIDAEDRFQQVEVKVKQAEAGSGYCRLKQVGGETGRSR
jgi:hypothetical protein